MDNANPEGEEMFSEDPEENLKIENEILKLKMQMEIGAQFESMEGISPEIENDFLRHIQQYESAWQNEKQEKIFDTIGRPEFIKADDLLPGEIDKELERVKALLSNHQIELDILGSYDALVIYRFITEELFEHETTPISIPGMTSHYVYEEFHPNHKMDIESRATEFLNHWFERNFNGYSWELANELVLPDGTILTKSEAIEKFNNFFYFFSAFSGYSFVVDDVQFEWGDDDKGLSHVEGSLFYKGELEKGEVVEMSGPFKLYLSNEHGGWEIFSLVMPGFKW